MDMEDSMFNAMKYIKFSGGMDPRKTMYVMIRSMELKMLQQLRGIVDTQISILQGQGAASSQPQQPTDDEMNPFDILGVTFTSTEDDVKKAYKEKAKTAHPDHGGSNEEMAKVNAAYQAICMFKGWKP